MKILKYDEWRYKKTELTLAEVDEDSLSGKEAKIVIDGKEYTATLKLI